MTKLRATKSGVTCGALLLAAISSVQAAGPVANETSHTGPSTSSALMEHQEGLSRPGAGPYRSGIGLRQLTKDPAPCGPKQIHLFVNRPCVPGKGGSDPETNTDHTSGNQTGSNDSGSNHTGNGGSGPVIVLGGSPYHLDDNGPSGDHPNTGDNPPPHGDIKLPDHFQATPEPTYIVVTGIAFAAVWFKRRTA